MSDSPAPVSDNDSLPSRSLVSGVTYSVFQYAGLLGVLAFLVLIFSLMSDHFLSQQTLVTVANNIPDLLVISVGMTLVLIIGGIDLSVGSLLALSSALLGVCMVDWGSPLWSAVPVCLGVGAVCGMLNGVISVKAGIPSFIVTLGMLEMARGSAYLITDSQTKYIGSSIEWIGVPLKGFVFSPAFLLALVIVAAGHYLLTRTVFGRYCVAIGTNAEAVRMSGIRTAPYSVAVFTISGLLCGLAGVMQTSRLSSADPNAAVGLELSAIAACVIGGTSLMGGRGSVINTFFGVLIIAVLQTGLAQIGATDPIKRVITGAVIIVAVLLDVARQRWKQRG
ncbi:ABC transporter permease [Gimesia maris]|uniref:Ribose transport system permease protein RbsC n=1 Tax=Gimesia maris TaxID=122 RepID=A0ABX5YL06_9PLAN|nr:ABC transporter permease [Gimesia maris]EDL57193.1 ribose transport system permease protein RbsC [Gimesia maris DSM 8797]QEG16332.1 Ribose transport system permease protein RbsC [Gimesia maris]QGQ30467.1 ABC transporter permease [Gimesia maris]